MKFSIKSRSEDLFILSIWGAICLVLGVLPLVPLSAAAKEGAGDPPNSKAPVYERGHLPLSLGRGPAPSSRIGGVTEPSFYTSTHLRLIKRSVSPLLTIGQLSDALGRGR